VSAAGERNFGWITRFLLDLAGDSSRSMPQQPGHQQAATAPAQGDPEAIGALMGRAQALGEWVEQPLAEGQVLLAAAFSPAEAGLPPGAGDPLGARGEGQQGLEVVEKPRRGIGPGASTPSPGAGRHPEQWAQPFDDPTPG
jgi:hypothetical protein